MGESKGLGWHANNEAMCHVCVVNLRFAMCRLQTKQHVTSSEISARQVLDPPFVVQCKSPQPQHHSATTVPPRRCRARAMMALPGLLLLLPQARWTDGLGWGLGIRYPDFQSPPIGPSPRSMWIDRWSRLSLCGFNEQTQRKIVVSGSGLNHPSLKNIRNHPKPASWSPNCWTDLDPVMAITWP